MASLWKQTAAPTAFPALEGDLKTDVLIIGGGLAGVLCAWKLKKAGVDCALVEADTIGGKTTGNTTAKLTSQHGLIYQKLLKEFGPEKARLYYEANEEALSTYRTLCQGMDCDFEEKDAFVYSLDDRGALEREMEALRVIGAPAQLAERVPLPLPTMGAVKFPRQAQFHPLKFLYAIARDLPIYEHTPVLELAPGKAVTEKGTIQAREIVVCTHFPFLNKHGSYFLKLYQERSYVIALENAQQVDGMYLDEQIGGLSFRNQKDLLLLGGGGHRTGKPGEGWEKLRAFARFQYPHAKEVAHWATQDCMSLDGVPYIGRYSASVRGLYVATGFNKWGMTSSMAAAGVLTGLITKGESPYEALFSPSRTVFRPQLALNSVEAAISLLTPTTPRCPHMGCALKWNSQEHTWDCPCHGSRFTEQGGLIEGPATGDLK